MPTYICKCCSFSTLLKTNYTNHMKTNKHISKSKCNLTVNTSKQITNANTSSILDKDKEITFLKNQIEKKDKQIETKDEQLVIQTKIIEKLLDKCN
jgi:hypothetical protein